MAHYPNAMSLSDDGYSSGGSYFSYLSREPSEYGDGDLISTSGIDLEQGQEQGQEREEAEEPMEYNGHACAPALAAVREGEFRTEYAYPSPNSPPKPSTSKPNESKPHQHLSHPDPRTRTHTNKILREQTASLSPLPHPQRRAQPRRGIRRRGASLPGRGRGSPARIRLSDPMVQSEEDRSAAGRRRASDSRVVLHARGPPSADEWGGYGVDSGVARGGSVGGARVPGLY